MKILVTVNQVPDTSGKVAVNPDGTLDARSRVPSGFTATLPEVSGTCLTVTRIFIFPFTSYLT